MEVIAVIHNGFNEKFGIPRQSCLAETESVIVFEKKYSDPDFIRGIEEFSHIWLIWDFSEAKRDKIKPTVRPPKLGGNVRMGVFATRSPFRPNSIGLSCVKLVSVNKENGLSLKVLGADLLNGTPIYDIKPYIPLSDCHPEAVGGFSDEHSNERLQVVFDPSCVLSEEETEELVRILQYDPRPGYQKDPFKEYGFNYKNMNICFKVSEGVLTVTQITLP